MKIKLLLVLIGVLFFADLNAQPYKSIFGKSKTCWNISFEQGDWYETDSLFSNSDTIINSLNYKIIDQPTDYFYKYQKYYIREDTNTGKYYIRNVYEMQNEYLFMDLSLNVGDTFIIHNKEYFSPDSIAVVDSIYNIGDKKVIKTNYIITTIGHVDNCLRFFEAIGPNNGINYMFQELWDHLHYGLICQFKDDTLYFHNPSAFETEPCHVSGGGSVEENEMKVLKVFPNPLTDITTIETTNNKLIKTIRIYNLLGQEVYYKEIGGKQKVQLYRNDLIAGIFVYRVQTEDGNMFAGKLVVQ